MSLSEERLAKIFYCPKSENFFYSYLDILFVLGHFMKSKDGRTEPYITPTNWNFQYKLFMIVDGEERKPWRNTFKSEKRFPLCTLQTLPSLVDRLWTGMRGSVHEERWVFQCNAIERKYWKEFNLLQDAREVAAERAAKIEADAAAEAGIANEHHQ